MSSYRPLCGIAFVVLALAAPPARGDDIASLVARLRAGDVQARWEAARALGRMDGDVAPALPALAHALYDEDVFVRRAVVQALGRIGTPAVGWIVAALADRDPDVRCQAAKALQALGPGATLAGPGLVRLLDDDDELVRDHAARALVAVGADSEAMVRALVTALGSGHLGRDGTAAVMTALGGARAHALGSVPTLLAALDSPDDVIVGHAADAIGGVVEASIDGRISVLGGVPSGRALREARSLLRACSIAACQTIARDRPLDADTTRPGSEATHALEEDMYNLYVLRGKRPIEEVHGVDPAGFDVDAERIATVVRELDRFALGPPEGRARHAARASSRIGLAALRGMHAVAAALGIEEWRYLAAREPKILDEEVLPVFIAAAKVRAAQSTYNAGIRGLLYMSTWSEAAMDEVVRLLENGNPYLLGRLLALPTDGAFAPRVVPALVSVVHDRTHESTVRADALEILDALGGEAAIAAIRRATGDANDRICYMAVAALARREPARLAELLSWLAAPDEGLRRDVYRFLETTLGPAQHGIGPALVAIAADRASPGRVHAINLLDRVGDASMVAALEQAVAGDPPGSPIVNVARWVIGRLRTRPHTPVEPWEAAASPR